MSEDKFVYLDQFLLDHCNSIKSIYDRVPYFSFILICAGIEFLGKCLDDSHEFSYYDKTRQQTNSSRNNFKNAIEKLLPKYIKANKEYNLFSSLRNGMLHSLIPTPNLWLRQRYNADHPHLSNQFIKGNDRLVLIIEDFHEDYEKACYKLIEMIKNGELRHPKTKKPVLTT